MDNTRGDDPSVDPFMMESLLTTGEYAEENPETVRAMVRALDRAVEKIADSTPEEVRKVVQNALNPEGTVSMEMTENTMLLDGRTEEVSAAQLFATFTPAYLPEE